MHVVIMAGGKGTRLAQVNSELPKPMVPVFGKPILEWQIRCLCAQGFRRITIVTGHLREKIRDYFQDGSAFGAKIDYFEEEEPLGTAGALFALKSRLTDDFLLLNGDILFNVDVDRFVSFHKNSGAAATLFTHPNDHPFDSGIVIADSSGRVTNWLHKEDPRTWYRNRINAGLHILSPEILNSLNGQKADLDRDLLKPMIPEGRLFCYDSPEYVLDIGTPARLEQAASDLEKGVVEQRCLTSRQKAVFLDRDGTINRYVGFLKDIDSFELLDGVAELIRSVNRSGSLCIVVTNQPVIARGDLGWPELERIHQKMETLLGLKGAYVNDIFVCPHHPEKGFPGEVAEYKIVCDCRKPKPGLIFQAAEKYNIDLSQSWMIGDGENDVLAGAAAGCRTIRVDTADGRFPCALVQKELFPGNAGGTAE